MRTGLVIADFEMSFSTSFKHTARVKYEVDFNNSNIIDTLDNMEQLKNNMSSNKARDVHVGLPITLKDVEHVQLLLKDLIQRY